MTATGDMLPDRTRARMSRKRQQLVRSVNWQLFAIFPPFTACPFSASPCRVLSHGWRRPPSSQDVARPCENFAARGAAGACAMVTGDGAPRHRGSPAREPERGAVGVTRPGMERAGAGIRPVSPLKDPPHDCFPCPPRRTARREPVPRARRGGGRLPDARRP